MDNNDKVFARINKDLADVVWHVTEWAEDLLRDYIQKYVYDWGAKMKERALKDYHQETAYYIHNNRQPTGQFMQSITHKVAVDTLYDYVSYKILSDPTKMSVDVVDNLHGSQGVDHRYDLLKRLNEAYDDLGNNARWRWWTQRRPFFDMYIEELDDSIHIKFINEMHKKGMKPRRESGDIHIQRVDSHRFMQKGGQ